MNAKLVPDVERYVVSVFEADPQTGPQTFRRYVWALCHQPYSNKEGRRFLVESIDDAFVFTTMAAAEVAAVWVGGDVETLKVAKAREKSR